MVSDEQLVGMCIDGDQEAFFHQQGTKRYSQFRYLQHICNLHHRSFQPGRLRPVGSRSYCPAEPDGFVPGFCSGGGTREIWHRRQRQENSNRIT